MSGDLRTSLSAAGTRMGVGTADAPRQELTEHDVREVVRGEVTEREEATGVLDGHGRTDEADRLRAEATVRRRHLGD